MSKAGRLVKIITVGEIAVLAYILLGAGIIGFLDEKPILNSTTSVYLFVYGIAVVMSILNIVIRQLGHVYLRKRLSQFNVKVEEVWCVAWISGAGSIGISIAGFLIFALLHQWIPFLAFCLVALLLWTLNWRWATKLAEQVKEKAVSGE